MPDTSADPIVVLMTASNRDEATRIAEMLVEAQLAACVQVLPEMESIYRWKGETQRDKEVLLLAKTTRERFADLEREVRLIHSYETPEIVAVPAVEASQPYFRWLLDAVSGQGEKDSTET